MSKRECRFMNSTSQGGGGSLGRQAILDHDAVTAIITGKLNSETGRCLGKENIQAAIVGHQKADLLMRGIQPLNNPVACNHSKSSHRQSKTAQCQHYQTVTPLTGENTLQSGCAMSFSHSDNSSIPFCSDNQAQS